MPANRKKMVELGMVPPLAKAVVAQMVQVSVEYEGVPL